MTGLPANRMDSFSGPEDARTANTTLNANTMKIPPFFNCIQVVFTEIVTFTVGEGRIKCFGLDTQDLDIIKSK